MTRQEAFDAMAEEVLAGHLIGKHDKSKEAWYADTPLGQAIDKATRGVPREQLDDRLLLVAENHRLSHKGQLFFNGWRIVNVPATPASR